MTQIKVGRRTVITVSDERPDQSQHQINLPAFPAERLKYAATARNPHKILGVIPDTRIPVYIKGQRAMFSSEIMRMVDNGDMRGLLAAQSFIGDPAYTLLIEKRVMEKIAESVAENDTATMHVKVDQVINGYICGSVSISTKNGSTFTFNAA